MTILYRLHVYPYCQLGRFLERDLEVEGFFELDFEVGYCEVGYFELEVLVVLEGLLLELGYFEVDFEFGYFELELELGYCEVGYFELEELVVLEGLVLELGYFELDFEFGYFELELELGYFELELGGFLLGVLGRFLSLPFLGLL